MAESDDEIYKKAYADEQRRIQIEAIKAQGRWYAQHYSGLSPGLKKSRLGRWFQRQKILIRGGSRDLVYMTRYNLQNKIDAASRELFRQREELARLERAGLRVNRGDHYSGDIQHKKMYIQGERNHPQDVIDAMESLIADYQRELELRERLNTY